MHFKKALNVSIYKVFRAFFTQFLAKVRFFSIVSLYIFFSFTATKVLYISLDRTLQFT